MLEVANTLITVMRGTAVNSLGDETDVGVPIYQHVPASLLETGHTTFDRASTTRRTIRTVTCMVPPWADIDTDDTIMDERCTPPAYYMVESMQRQPSLVGVPANLILTLRARSGVAATTD